MTTQTAPGSQFPTTRALIAVGLTLALSAAAFLVAAWSDGSDPTSPPLSASGPAAEPREMPAVAQGGTTPTHAVYVVGSTAAAERLRASLASLEMPPELAANFINEVTVAASAEEADTLVAAIIDGNRILAALGLPEDRVVNMFSADESSN